MIRPRVWMLLVLIAEVALPLGVVVNRYRFQQGQLARLRRLGADITLEPGWLGPWWPKVVGIEAHGRGFSDEGLRLLAGLTDLRGVALIHTPTTDDGLAHLIRLRGLEVLYLEGTEVTDAGLSHVARMSGLKELIVCCGRITDEGLGWLRRASPKLKIEEGTVRL